MGKVGVYGAIIFANGASGGGKFCAPFTKGVKQRLENTQVVLDVIYESENLYKLQITKFLEYFYV